MARSFPPGVLRLPQRAAKDTIPKLMKSVLLLALLALAGCATIDPPQVDSRILNEFSSRGVSDATLFKVRNGLPLTVGQVAESAGKGVPGPGLVS